MSRRPRSTAAEVLNDRVLPFFETHGGRWCYGKTPMDTFLDSVGLALEKYHARQAAVA